MKSLLFLKSSGSHVSKAAIVTIAALFPALVWAVCTCGFGDGYTLPGRFANVPSTGNPTRTGTWGSANGTQMEFYVTWAELGIAPNTPFNFHVSSSNASLGSSSFAAQIDDIAGVGSGPVLFEDGTPSSNLGYSFFSLASTADDLRFSSDGGLTYSYTPTANADGCDPAVTDLLTNPTGEFAADTGSGQPSAAFSFRVLVDWATDIPFFGVYGLKPD